jgi:hypothetical protein
MVGGVSESQEPQTLILEGHEICVSGFQKIKGKRENWRGEKC